MPNKLSREKSPYLLQHQNNPVDWYPWSDEAFQKAKNEDKPIFLSIGYSTCHWCHVMAHESFEDENIAALLRDFVCIKVDREERPDVDTVYMNVCQILTGSGGWPLTVFMTPEMKPFFAGTYFPKTSRYGMTGLTELLGRISRLWHIERVPLLETADKITAAIREDKHEGYGIPSKMLMKEAYHWFEKSFDATWGGFGSAPKFPTPHHLLFLMRFALLENEPKGLQMAETTLKAMARGGIFDQIGGGFSRYSTDEKWLTPHFEKMLYDNALLILAYLEAIQLTKNTFYAEVAKRTADYILRELADSEGGFYCSQDADSDGVEGKYYVFTPDEIVRALGREKGEKFCRLYDITAHGNFEGRSIPNRIEQRAEDWQADASLLDTLYSYRKARTSLHRDDKILLSWNAWAIIALARAGLILEEERYTAAAQKAQRFIEENMTDKQNRLFLRYRDAEAVNAGQLEDYAVYALALLALYGTTFDAEFLTQALYRARQMTALFEDKENGGHFISAHDAELLITRPKELYDGAIPSGNSVAAMVLEQLAGLTGESEWRDAADRQHRFIAGQIGHYPPGHSFALLAMSNSLYPHRELIGTGSYLPAELTAYLRNHPAHGLSILFKSPETESSLSEAAPFTAGYPLPERGTVWYLCENGTCKVPVTDFKNLSL